MIRHLRFGRPECYQLHHTHIVGREGIEPTSFGFSDQRSDLLSYLPKKCPTGYDPAISDLASRYVTNYTTSTKPYSTVNVQISKKLFGVPIVPVDRHAVLS